MHTCRDSVSPLSSSANSVSDSDLEATPPPTVRSFSPPTPLLNSKLRITPQCTHINHLPKDIIHVILSWLSSPLDVHNFMLVQKKWLAIAAPKLWFKLQPRSFYQLVKMINENDKYFDYVQRINLSYVASTVTNNHICIFGRFRKVKKLVLANCTRLVVPVLSVVISQMKELQCLDITNVEIDDSFLAALSRNCKQLDSLYGGSPKISDDGLKSLHSLAAQFRRLRFVQCCCVSADALTDLAVNCSNLVEFDVRDSLTPESMFNGFSQVQIFNILNKCPLLHEFVIPGSPYIDIFAFQTSASATGTNGTSGAISSTRAPTSNSRGISERPGTPAPYSRASTGTTAPIEYTDTERTEYVTYTGGPRGPHRSDPSEDTINNPEILGPHARAYSLRQIQLIACPRISLRGLKAMTFAMPFLRQLSITKTSSLTDSKIEALAQAYTRTLTHIQLSHCVNLTDKGVKSIAEYLPNLVYFEAGSCQKLTSESMKSLATLTKIERIGVVRCMKIDDDGVYNLCETKGPLARVHLSFCTYVTRRSICRLLNTQKIVHLSVSGIPAFEFSNLRVLMTASAVHLPPHYRDRYIVFSGRSVLLLKAALDVEDRATKALRAYEQSFPPGAVEHNFYI